MLKEIYPYSPEDPKYKDGILEINSELDALIGKLRIILFTEQGEVMGYPNLGMDLEDYLFNFNINDSVIKERFYAQIAAYIPERTYDIDIDIARENNITSKTLNLYIKVNGKTVMGITK